MRAPLLHSRFLLWLLAAVLLIGPKHVAHAQDTLLSTPSALTSTEAPVLKVLSWNIYMLPPLAKFTRKPRRGKRIGEVLKHSDFDVLVFQEAFHAGARRKIRRQLRETFPHELGPANRKWYSLKTNSGIWILSRIPLTELGTTDFEQCDGIDCWSRKGALLAEGEFNGQRFQVLGTHLEAGGPKTIKTSQYEELRELLDAHRKEGVPQLICGDMNTHRNDTAQYELMMKKLDAVNRPFDGARQTTSDGSTNDIKQKRGDSPNGSWIDYIFYRPNGIEADIRTYVRTPRKPWNRKQVDLSDHYAVEGQFVFP